MSEAKKPPPKPPLECRLCGKPFAREKQVANVRKKLEQPEELSGTCPACRRRGFAESVAKGLGL